MTLLKIGRVEEGKGKREEVEREGGNKGGRGREGGGVEERIQGGKWVWRVYSGAEIDETVSATEGRNCLHHEAEEGGENRPFSFPESGRFRRVTTRSERWNSTARRGVLGVEGKGKGIQP